MESDSQSDDRKKDGKKWIVSSKPDKERIMATFAPIVGCVSYQLFAFHAYFPQTLRRTFPVSHCLMENCMLYNSHIGIGLYLYTRRHMRLLPAYHRVMYSVYGSVIFNFGSILLWALTERLLPQSKLVRLTVAISAAFCLLFTGREYLQFVDTSI